MCSWFVLGGAVLLLTWGVVTGWITYPVWAEWHKQSAHWARVEPRLRRVGPWIWFAPLASGGVALLIAALLDCPTD